MPNDPFDTGYRFIDLEGTREAPKPYDAVEHDERIWETFRMLAEYRARGVMTKEKIIESLKRVVLDRW